MLHKKFLILLCGSLLGALGAWADDVGYVDCSGHPEETQIYAKPRKSQDVVVNLACGERFRVVVYGFIFSKVQTTDGKIGFILSSLISLDRVGGVPQQWETTRSASPANPPATTAAVAQPVPAPATPMDSVAKQALPAASPEQPANVQPVTAPQANVQPVAVQAVTAQPIDPQPMNAPSVSVVPAAAPAKPAAPTVEPASMPTETTVSETVAAPASAAVPQPQPAPEESAAAAPPEVTPAAPASAAPSPAPPAIPEPAPSTKEAAVAPMQPAQPSRASTSRPQPATYAVRSASMSEPIERTSWEKPNPGGRNPSLLEIFGGYSFTRTNNSGTSANFNGALASFGVNLKPWIQLVGDSSYGTVTVSGTKNTLYGNHFGPRFFFRRVNRWNMTPFAEFLIGGSRADTSISGVSGYSTSQNCISYKVGGGVDIRAGRHFEFRAIDAGYYRTSFGTNTTQNNYYVSAGFVIRLFGGSRGY